MKTSFSFKRVSVSVFVLGSVAACGPMSRPVREGDPVTVRFKAGAIASVRSETECSLPVSHLIATSKKFGTVTRELKAIVNAADVFSVSSGSSVLKFDEVQPIVLSASDDWVFQYIGLFGFECDVSAGSRVMSAGMTEAMSVMNPETQVPLEIQTLTAMDLAFGNSAQLPSNTNFSKVTIKIPVPSGPSCTGTYDLKLKDGTDLTEYHSSYSFFPSGGYVQFTVSPLPKNMSYVLTLMQSNSTTVTISFTTGTADLQSIDIPAIAGFCPNSS